MILDIPRVYTQAVSLTSMLVGLLLLISNSTPFFGVACVGFSCWILMMSESVLHNKIQVEMTTALETLRKRQEAEIQDLLLFLKREKIFASPFDTIAGAKRLCDKIYYPAMVLSTSHQIIKANKKMHDLLGWSCNELNGKPAHLINNVVVMSKLGELCASSPHSEKNALITQYVYTHKDGSKIFGQMDATKIKEGAFMVVFHPENDLVLNYEQIKNIVFN
tara:strand:- start:28 stop:687 length:660 start_codon:yes stop_codon:yes gene_type:complete